MFRCFNRSIARVGLSVTAVILANGRSGLAQSSPPEWPREIEAPEATITIYQPQLESFKDDKLTARAAVSVLPAGTDEPVFGAVWFAARVATDRDTRMVTLLDLDVPDARFPNAEQKHLDKLAAILKSEIPKWNLSISLDRLLTGLELVEKEQAAAAELENKPPNIILVTHPAVLVTIDGQPELRPVEKSKLMRLVNTPFLIVLDPGTKAYYLKGGEEWLKASDVMGPWQSATPPAEVAALATDDAGDESADEPGSATPAGQPQIIVATEPTELIICDGGPKYTPLSGTGLLYVSNTENDMFMEIASQQYYVLLSGRWFAAGSLEGPWSYVPSDKLPEDFAKISPESDKGHVLAQIAGTDEAADAVNDSYIPQTAAIDRANATVDVEYDGQPKFEPVEGTSMQYAVNTSYDVVRVENQYYCCHEAVWYTSPQPTGPWIVCASVPQAIYTIPPACPAYPVTYVRVYQATPTVVYVGYTPGYVGSYVYGGTVVYGTGYVYRGWCGAVYCPRPRTFGFSVHYNSVTGSWGFRVGVSGPNGWIVGGYRNGKYVTGGWVAGGGRYGGSFGGWWGHGCRYPRPTPYRVNVNRNINVGNVNVGNRVNIANRQNIYNRPGNINRNVPAQLPVNRPGRVERPAQLPSNRPGGTGRPAQLPANNVFTDRDGNVFRRTNEGWQRQTGQGWSPPDRKAPPSGGNLGRPGGAERPSQLPARQPGQVQRPTDRTARPGQLPAVQPGQRPPSDRAVRPQPTPRPAPSLERDYRSRQRGTNRTNNFQGMQRGTPRAAPARPAPRAGRGGRR